MFLNLYNQNHKEHSPTVAQYEEKIEYLKSISKNTFQEKTWEKIIFQNKETKKEINWQDLDEFKKQIFFFTMGNRTLNVYLRMEEYWIEEIKKFDDFNHKLINSAESRPATKQEVENYLKSIKLMRIDFVKEFESFSYILFKKYKIKFTAEEIKGYSKKIQDAKEKQ